MLSDTPSRTMPLTVAGSERVDHVITHADQPFGMDKEFLPLGREGDQPTVAFDEADAQIFLELLDARRDQGLSRFERFGRLAKAAQVRNLYEGLKDLEIG